MTAGTVESQGQNLTRILVVDIPLGGTLSVIGSGNVLNHFSGRISNPPNLLGDDLREAVDETVDASNLFHFLSLFLSLFYYRHYTGRNLKLQEANLTIFLRFFYESPKSLWANTLRRIGAAGLVVKSYTTRLCVTLRE